MTSCVVGLKPMPPVKGYRLPKILSGILVLTPGRQYPGLSLFLEPANQGPEKQFSRDCVHRSWVELRPSFLGCWESSKTWIFCSTSDPPALGRGCVPNGLVHTSAAPPQSPSEGLVLKVLLSSFQHPPPGCSPRVELRQEDGHGNRANVKSGVPLWVVGWLFQQYSQNLIA